MNWLSLKDQRPECETYVLLGNFPKKGKPRYAVGCLRFYRVETVEDIPEARLSWDTGLDDPEPLKAFTHWMPLPEKPG